MLWLPRQLCIGETDRNLNTWLTEHKWVTTNVVELNNNIAELKNKTYYQLGLCYMLNLLCELLPDCLTLESWYTNLQQTTLNHSQPLLVHFKGFTQQKILTMYTLLLSQLTTYCNLHLQTTCWKFHLTDSDGSDLKTDFDRSLTPPIIPQALETFACFSRPSEIWNQLIIFSCFQNLYIPLSCFLMCHCFILFIFYLQGMAGKESNASGNSCLYFSSATGRPWSSTFKKSAANGNWILCSTSEGKGTVSVMY